MRQIYPNLMRPCFAEHKVEVPRLTDLIKDDLLIVEREFSAFLAAHERDAAALGESYRRLWRSMSESAGGGTRLRPRLVLAAFHGFIGAVGLGSSAQAGRGAAVQTAIVFELLHAAFLLHDDAVEGDMVSRRLPNIAGEFTAEAFVRCAGFCLTGRGGQPAAILTGDLLLHGAEKRIATCWSADCNADAPALTEQKTSVYSVAGPLIAGAILADAGEGVLELLGEYGRLVGIAFQLGDDLRGVFCDEVVTGKKASGDLREGKETTLVAFARGTREWQGIEPLLGRPKLSAADSAELSAAFERCGARAYVERLLAEQVSDALGMLDSPLVPSALAATLAHIALSSVGRAAA